jgi:flagellar basal-body rod modification protein FlgD
MTTPVSYTPISSVLPNASTAAGQTSKPKDQMGQDTFLKLLVAQLKYQDPMNPAQGADFMAQTAQFTSLEKLTQVADLQSEQLGAQRLLSASSMIGRTVTYAGEGGDISGTVTSARLSIDGPVLRVADKDVPLTAVKEVSNTPAS